MPKGSKELMKSSQQSIQGLVIVLVTVIMFLGSLVAALAEGQIGGKSPPPAATDTGAFIPSPTPPPQISSTSTSQIDAPTPTSFPVSPTIPFPTSTPALQITHPLCNSPDGWVPLITNFGDSLEDIAARYGITVEELKSANCLTGDSLPAGAVLFVPQSQSGAGGQDGCIPPSGYVQYTVKRGDTLYSLSKAYGVSVAVLQQANCMGSSTNIVTGTKIWVPNVPTRTPTSSTVPRVGAQKAYAAGTIGIKINPPLQTKVRI